MNASKMLELQQQMKQNQLDMADFINDLDSWSGDVKKKDEALKKDKPSENSELPPVRNSLSKKRQKKKKKVHKVKTSTTEGKEKINSFDYKAWDKFDVNKALEDLDGEKSSESEYETDEEWEEERKKQQSIAFKDQGNDFYKQGQYDEAVECYTRAIDCDPTNAVLPANRAIALLKQQKFGAAELDCTCALQVDPQYIKAYHRRGTARAALGKYAEACQDFEAVLEREPRNKQATAELHKVQMLLRPAPTLQSEALQLDDSRGLLKAVYKPADQRSQKPLKRIQIEEIGIEVIRIAAPKQSEATKKVQAEENAMFEQQFLRTKMKASDDKHMHAGDKVMDTDDKDMHVDDKDRRAGDTDIHVDNKDMDDDDKVMDAVENNLRNRISEITHQVVNESGKDEQTSDTKTESNQVEQSDITTNAKDKNKMSSPPSSVRVSTTPTSSSPKIPAIPTSSFQFQIDFRCLKNSPSQFYSYLKAIDLSHFPSLFGQSLESEMLTAILSVLQDYYIPEGDNVYKVLKSLSLVKRFQMTVLFLSSAEKKVVSSLFDYIKKQNSASSQEIAALSKTYGV